MKFFGVGVTDLRGTPQTPDVKHYVVPAGRPAAGPAVAIAPGPEPASERAQTPVAADSSATGTATERPSFRALFLAQASYVGSSLRRLGVRERDLEDVTHDVFIAVYRHLEEYDPARPIKPWLFGFALRTALSYRRRAGFTREVIAEGPDGIEATDQAPGADERLVEKETRDLVIAALDAVADERRPVLILHDIDGVSMPEIATALGIPLNTGYSRLRLARADFAAAVQRIRARSTSCQR